MSESVVQPGEVRDIPLGPHTVPRIDCSACGTDHHPDAARHSDDEYPPQCVECNAFLREPTPEEDEKFGWFIAWNGRHMTRDESEVRADGGTPADGMYRFTTVDFVHPYDAPDPSQVSVQVWFGPFGLASVGQGLIDVGDTATTGV